MCRFFIVIVPRSLHSGYSVRDLFVKYIRAQECSEFPSFDRHEKKMNGENRK